MNTGRDQAYRPDLAVIMSEIGSGGMGKMRVHLMNALVEAGYAVDLLLGKQKGAHRLELDPRIRVIDIGTTNAILGVPRLALYLRRNKPPVLLTQRIRVTVLSHRAKALTSVDTRIFTTGETHESTAVRIYPEDEQRKRLAQVRKYFSRNDGMITTSRGVAADYAELMGWPIESIAVAPNPVITPDIDTLAGESVEHPWFQPDEPPVIISVGRLQDQKDFPTLIRAFALFRERHRARLVILGEGHLRSEFSKLSEELGISADFDMPGFVDNVYPYMARSRMFVMSSAWEGLGGVLVEAMAVGTPVVSTDCPSGPSEVLEDGRVGSLVPVGDVEALADAMQHTLEHPTDPEVLRRSARDRYSASASAREYARILQLDDTASAPIRRSASTMRQ